MKTNEQFIEVSRTPKEWLEEANKLSQRLVGTDAHTAWAAVQAGMYEGTPFVAEMSQLMFLACEEIDDG